VLGDPIERGFGGFGCGAVFEGVEYLCDFHLSQSFFSISSQVQPKLGPGLSLRSSGTTCLGYL
jgi:hypothetical protein